MEEFRVQTSKRSELVDITSQVRQALDALGAGDGVATVFCPHTTAGITINENADPSVCRDLVATLEQLVPAHQGHFTHGEGNSDSHVKSTLVGASEQILVKGGKPVLGTWQGIYFAEFDGPRTRKVQVAFTASSLDQ